MRETETEKEKKRFSIRTFVRLISRFWLFFLKMLFLWRRIFEPVLRCVSAKYFKAPLNVTTVCIHAHAYHLIQRTLCVISIREVKQQFQALASQAFGTVWNLETA